jgi:hypothetical protein
MQENIDLLWVAVIVLVLLWFFKLLITTGQLKDERLFWQWVFSTIQGIFFVAAICQLVILEMKL